jgi:thymidylate synthase ThyX
MGLEVNLIASTGNMGTEEMIEFSQNCARVCYTDKDFLEVKKEPINKKLQERLMKSGHHSVFEHSNLTFNLNGIPKALAMILNNEKQYATSEKSARYTIMSEIDPVQKKLYEKWMEILIPGIEKIYPKMEDKNSRKNAIKKISQENARYMTSVFTPTKMVHTINLRQLNFLQQQFNEFVKNYSEKDNGLFKKNLSKSMDSFLEQTKEFRIKDLDNQTDRHLSLFENIKNSSVKDKHYSNIYSTNYLMSFAGLAQAHRHRTINYSMEEPQLNSPKGFFIPPIITYMQKEKEWINDLKEISKTDFPQAQNIRVYETGKIEDFRSKATLRMCGHAQLEIMKNTLKTAEEYKLYQEIYGKNSLKPKCIQNYKCPSPCVWKGIRALERLV